LREREEGGRDKESLMERERGGGRERERGLVKLAECAV
jgi:hypothetical protein